MFTIWEPPEKFWRLSAEGIEAQKREGLVERKETLARPGLMRRRYQPQSQGTVFALSTPNSKSREEVAEINAELLQRANRLGAGYQSLIAVPKEKKEEPETPEEGEIDKEENLDDTEGHRVIMRGDNLPIVDMRKYHIEGKETHYKQINRIENQLTASKKITVDRNNKAVFDFILDPKTMISKTAKDPAMTRCSKRRED